MAGPTLEEWKGASVAILHAIHSTLIPRVRGSVGAPSYETMGFERFFAKATDGVVVPEAWSRAFQDALAARGEKCPFADDGYRNERLGEMRVMRLGHASLTGDASWVAPAEAVALAGTRLLPPPRMRKAVVEERGESFAAPFCAPYPLLPARARTMTVPCRGHAVVVVERVDVGSTRHAFTLGFADHAETVDVLEYEGDLFRPVMAPGTLRGATEAEFLSSALGDDAWADSPFLPPGAQSRVPLSDYAREAPPGNQGDVERLEAAMTEATRRCGRLLSVGGTVLRRTAAPEFFVTWQHEPRNHGAYLDWRMGEMNSRFVPGPFDREDWRSDWFFGSSNLRMTSAAAYSYGHDEIGIARDVLAMVARTFECRVGECSVWPPTGDPDDPAAGMERRLTAFMAPWRDDRSKDPSLLADYGTALRKACAAMADRDVQAMRAAFASLPRPVRERVSDRAEFAYMRAVIAAAGKALKGDYGSGEPDLDLSEF